MRRYAALSSLPSRAREVLHPPGEAHTILNGLRPPAGRRSHTGPPRARLLCQGLGTGLGNLRVLLGGGAGHADRPDDLAVNQDRDSALERAGAAQSQQPEVKPTRYPKCGGSLA